MSEEIMTLGPDDERLESVHKEEEETPAAPSAEDKTDEEEEGSQPDKEAEDKIPFHKHPRWEAMMRKNKELEAELESLKGTVESRQHESDEEEEVEIPQWFVDLYGDDPETFKAYLQAEEQKEAEREERIIRRMAERKDEESRKEQEYQEWVDDQLETLRESGEDFEDNALMKVMVEYAPSDAEGNLDFSKGLAILRKLGGGEPGSNKSVSDKKRIAASTTPSGGDTNNQDVATSETFAKNRPW